MVQTFSITTTEPAEAFVSMTAAIFDPDCAEETGRARDW